ncbi:MAG TPA: class I SAM-dependent methyltransferase [Spirochaetota bacterium]|nr:class I SAM-dependent methyltransferase [Spirochaetota bacterium]
MTAKKYSKKKASANFKKYHTSNPVVRRLISNFMQHITTIVNNLTPGSIIDLGCGEGQTARALYEKNGDINYHGIDINNEAVRKASAANLPACFQFSRGDILNITPEKKADMVICLEVLEHLPHPQAAVDKISSTAREYAVISVPWEPFFQIGSLLRGKYIKNLGNHPEHIQHFNKKKLTGMLQKEFSTVSIKTSFPWLIAVCKKQKNEFSA